MLKKLLLFIVLLVSYALSAQTMYWVGGSGNFNDGNHWSLTSGGNPANLIPNSNSNIIFDGETISQLNILVQNTIKIKSLNITRDNVAFQKENSQSVLEISGDFVNVSGSFESNITFSFLNNSNLTEHIINSGAVVLNSDFKIDSGKWKINKIITSSNNSLSIENSRVTFQGAYIEVGDLSLSNNLEVQIKGSFFQVNRTLYSANNSNEVVSKSYLKGNFLTSTPTTIAAKFGGVGNSPASPCIPTPTVVKPSCVPGCDGKIIFTIPSPTSACYPFVPTPPFNIIINNAASCSAIPGINGLSAGTYTIDSVCNCGSDYTLLLFDQNSFIESQAAQVTTPNISAIITGFNPIKCFAACTGSIGVNFIGGVAPYNFTITPPTGAPTFTTSNGALSITNLCSGTLSISAIDSKSCTATFTTPINQPPQLLANATSTNITCNGFCTGAVNIAPTGGTPNYTVNWSTPLTQTLTAGGSSSQSGLCVSAISATVTDSKSCKVIYNTNITQPPAITLTVTKANLICGSLCDGAATVTASGGGGTYNYSWTCSASTGSTAVGLCAGPCTVTVTDNLNCVKTVTFSLTAPVILTATPTQTNLSCNSACIGAIKLNPSGGTPGPGYTFSWSPAVSITSTATALCAGAYSYTVTDNVNCTYTNSITITQPPAITLTVTKTDVTCFGACNGAAMGTVSGGTGAFTFSWSPGAPVPVGQGTGTITSLCPGTYTLKATDANGCIKTGTVSISQPTVIAANVTSVSPTCNGVCDGIINSAPTGGTGPYTFTLQPAAGAPIVGSPPFSGLCAGNYTLSIKDAVSCVKTQTINFTQPNPLTLSLSATALNCFNQCNSTISTVINGGTPTYTVNWNSGGPGPSIGGQCAGVHTATVTDTKGCQATASINIVSPPDMTVTISAVNPNCNAQCTGIATATITGGTPNYTVNWSNGTIGTSDPNLCLGTYTATVTDFKGCIKTQTISITTPPAITLTTANGTVTCAGTCDGTVSVTASGGTAGYSYSWNSVPTQTTAQTTNSLCAGNYIATVTDSKGCIASAAANVAQPPALTTSISNVLSSCNVCIGAATASGVGGTGPYTYSWSPGGQAASTATNLCVGVQTVTVKDSKGCTSTQTVQILQTINIVITPTSNTLSCNGVCSGVATANASGGTGPGTYSFTWTPAPIQSTQTATALCAGPHTVTVSDANGCSNTNVVSFVNPPAITLTVNQTNISCNSVCNGSASATATGGTGVITYSWSNGATTPSISGLCAGPYTVTVTDANACSQTKTINITQTNSLTATFTTNNPSGCGLTNGSISFVPGGGLAPYSFTWTPGPSVNPRNNLGAGTYVLDLKDTNGCALSFTATLSDPLGPTASVTSNSIVCFGSCTGSASLAVTAITPTFTVSWSAPIPATNTSTLASSLCAGNYQATITDGNGCITNQTVTIAGPTQIVSTGTVTNLSCNAACSASIDVTASGGTGTLSYSWSPAGGPVQDPVNLCAGTYSVNITDLNNCSVTNTYVVAQPAALTLSFNKKNVSCNGVCTGAVRAIISGGTSPYTYTWTPVGAFAGANIDTIVNLCSGIYTVNVRDLNGCTISGTVSITEPTVLTSTIVSTNIKCNGQCNGTAVINPTGGTFPYFFSYNTTPPTLSQTTNTLCVGTYTGLVTDANGCSSSHGFSITEPLPIVITSTVSNPKCNAVCNGSVATTVTGGNSATYQYSWTPSVFPSIGNPTGLCAGIYTVTVTDDSLCTQQAIVTLVQPAALIANTSFTNPVCSGGCNGIVSANPSGGTSPFSYTWTVPSNNQTVSNLCAGSYTVIVSDLNLCQDTQMVTLTSPAPITVNPGISPATCGISDGSIDAPAAGGLSPYTYNWLNPVIIGLGQQTNSLVTTIPAGTYTVIVTDAAACSATIIIPLSNSNGPTGATITSTNVTCNGQCNGTLNITNPVGGTPSYTLSWVGFLPINSTITNLCAGTYTAQIKDSNGCLFFPDTTIVEPQVIDDNENITSALCFGNCTGAIALNPTGGNGTYSYSWTPAANTGTITNICPGVYTATITDILGCTFTANYNLPSLTSITSNTVATNNICFNNCNGTLMVVNVAGGLPPYTYNWTDPLGQSTPLANGLCNGNYSVNITDANNCSNSIPAVITSPPPVTFTPTVTQPGCGLCDGSALINPTGGTPSYTLVWSNNQTGNTLTNLCAGVYMAQITDGNGCISDTNIVINSSSTITGETVVKADVTCAGVCDGTVSVTAIGGVAPITYHWLHNNSSSQSLVGLCAGTYFCNMADTNGCIRTASVVIGSTTTLTITSQVTQSSCSANTGSITVNVTGGTGGPYTYAWLPAGSTPTVTNLAPGSYTLTVSDGSCSKTQIYSVNSFSAPTLSFTKKDISCGGVCDGNIALTISGGSPGYTTLWSNAATTTSINALCAGSYSVIVTDVAGCKAVQNFSLTTESPLVFSLPDVNNLLCSYTCDGSITSIPIGGTLPYTFSWTPAAPSAPTTNSLCAGNYSVSVTDVNGCLASETYTVISPPSMTLTAVVTDASCSTVADGAIDITVSGGNPNPVYTYSWTPGNFITQDIINVFSGTYSVSIADGNGCKKDSSFLINATIVVNAVAGNDSIFCLNGPFTLNGSNSTGGITFQWLQLPLSGVISNSIITTVPSVAGTNTYVLVATNGSCVDQDSIVITVNALPSVDAGPLVSIPALATTPIGGSPTSATGVSYTWSPSSTLDNPAGPNPTTSTTITTNFTVTVTDANGCFNSDTITVFVYPEINIPNGFSPNGDGKNDVWQIDLIYQFPDSEVEVYNRWGEQLFYSKGYQIPFNGQYKGKNLPVGTYYYIINLNNPTYPEPYTGPLTIFR